MDKVFSVDREVLFYSFRYALGRRTFAPSNVVENIKANIQRVSDGDMKAYIKEINKCNYFGDKMDERFWKEFKDYLEDELKQRNSNEG